MKIRGEMPNEEHYLLNLFSMIKKWKMLVFVHRNMGKRHPTMDVLYVYITDKEESNVSI